MSKQRSVADQELALWQEVTKDVSRLGKKRRILRHPKAQRATGSQDEVVKTKRAKSVNVSVPTPVPPVVPKLDGNTAQRLKRGKVEPEAVLDLHGLTQVQAHNRLITFVKRCADGAMRCILVVTGKGAPKTAPSNPARFELHLDRRSGVLKELVPRWLQEGDVRRYVTGVHTAHVRHGGEGALYVYLKKSRT